MQRNVWCRALQSGTVLTPPNVFGSAIKCAVQCNVGGSASCSRVLMPHPAASLSRLGGWGHHRGHLWHRHKESILSFHVNLTFGGASLQLSPLLITVENHTILVMAFCIAWGVGGQNVLRLLCNNWTLSRFYTGWGVVARSFVCKAANFGWNVWTIVKEWNIQWDFQQ